MNCSTCGKKLNEDDVFCSKCGLKVEKGHVTELLGKLKREDTTTKINNEEVTEVLQQVEIEHNEPKGVKVKEPFSVKNYIFGFITIIVIGYLILNYNKAINTTKTYNSNNKATIHTSPTPTITPDYAETLKKANEQYTLEKYLDAYLAYKTIPESDKNYQEAKQKINEIVSKDYQKYLIDAKKQMDLNNYDEAIRNVNVVLEIKPDDKEIQSKLTEYKNARDTYSQEIVRKEEETAKQKKQEALGKLRKNVDEVKEMNWYYDKNTPEYANYNNLCLYMGSDKYNKSPWLRFRIQYADDDWLFIDNYIFKIDDKTYTINTSYGEVKRDNGSGGIWEWYDESINSNIKNIVDAIISSNKAVIRCQGDKYYKDRTITSSEKQGLKNIIEAYKILGGSF